jgi:hypothetical protein
LIRGGPKNKIKKAVTKKKLAAFLGGEKVPCKGCERLSKQAHRVNINDNGN